MSHVPLHISGGKGSHACLGGCVPGRPLAAPAQPQWGAPTPLVLLSEEGLLGPLTRSLVTGTKVLFL